jgi:hypothetical protein
MAMTIIPDQSFGLMYREVRASNLVKIDVEHRTIGPAEHPVNPAGFDMHSAVHAARRMPVPWLTPTPRRVRRLRARRRACCR